MSFRQSLSQSNACRVIDLPAQVVSSSQAGGFVTQTGWWRWSQRLAFPRRFLRHRLSGRRGEAISFLLLFAVAGLCLAILASGSSGDGDDQVLRLRQQSGPFAVAVFAPAGDLEAGPSDFSVLLQSRASSEVLQDATVALRAEQGQNRYKTQWIRASIGDSENKLLQSASLNLPDSGDWTLDVAVARGGRQADFLLPLHVAKPAAGMSFPWSYGILLGFSAILLFTYLQTSPVARSSCSLRLRKQPHNAARQICSDPDFLREALIAGNGNKITRRATTIRLRRVLITCQYCETQQ